MAVFFVHARGELPVDPSECNPGDLTYVDVPCTYTYWGYIEQFSRDGITAGCSTDPPMYCPSSLVNEAQMVAFMNKSWSAYHPVPRGTIYTYRDESNHVVTEATGMATGPTGGTLSTTRDNVYLGNLLVASYVSNSLGGPTGWAFYHSDHLGTPRLIEYAAGGNETHKYWPYRDEVSPVAPTQKLSFALMERDTESNHFYDHARSHDFNLGRFVTLEPTWFGAPEAPTSWNRYAYASNNPVIAKDPDGQFPIAVAIVVGAGILKGAENVVESYAEQGNFEGAGKEFGVGFVAGGLGAAAGFISKSPYIAGLVSGGVTEALNEAGHGESVNGINVAEASGIGFAGGALVKFLGPRPGTYTGRVLTPRSLSVLFAGRNITRQAFSPIIEGTAEALFGIGTASRHSNALPAGAGSLSGSSGQFSPRPFTPFGPQFATSATCTVTPGGSSCSFSGMTPISGGIPQF